MLWRHPKRSWTSGSARARHLQLEPLEARTLLTAAGLGADNDANLLVSMRAFLAGSQASLAPVAEYNSLIVSSGSGHDGSDALLPCCCPACLRTYLADGPLPTDTSVLAGATGGDAGPAGAGSPLSSIPLLNSLVGAAASIYLSFTGRFDATWGSYNNISTPVYDYDGDPTSFSNSELSSIQSIWARVAEDYSPFNINVTTATPPATLANGASVVIAIGGAGTWSGGTYGGIAYVNAFTNSAPNVGFVFSNNLGNGNARYVAEAASHEAGHTFGLQHQSAYNAQGARTSEYAPGNGATAPIMGNSYTATRGLWWNGTSTSSKTIQDDMSVIARTANGFGYRADDYGNSMALATPIAVSDTQLSGSGIITTTTDIDYFSFNTGAGQISLSVSVPTGINNLDARLELRDAAGALVASSAPTNSFGATIATSVAAGSYYLVVASQGNYGDVGQYTVSGTVLPDTSIRSPSGVVAALQLGPAVNVTWNDNASNESYYEVSRSADGSHWSVVAMLDADTTRYTDTDVAAGQAYYYRVRAGNQSDESNPSNTAQIAIDSASLVLAALYHDILGRAPDAVGWVSFAPQLLAGAGRDTVAHVLLNSGEYFGRFVDQLYANILHRAADPGGHSYWVNRLASGANENSVISGLLLSAEYAQQNPGNEAFVESLYQVLLARHSDSGGLAAWVGMLDAGQPRASVVQQLLACDERNRRIVDQAYVGLFGRHAEPEGLAYWSGRLQNESGFTPRSLVELLVAANEYVTHLTSS